MAEDRFFSGYLRLFSLRHSWCSIDESITTLLEVVIAVRFEDSTGTKLSFKGLQGITLGDLDSGRYWHLRIEDIRSSGLDRLHYGVSDLEQGGFAFNCRDFKVEERVQI
jgi:hypothetical protein